MIRLRKKPKTFGAFIRTGDARRDCFIAASTAYSNMKKLQARVLEDRDDMFQWTCNKISDKSFTHRWGNNLARWTDLIEASLDFMKFLEAEIPRLKTKK